MHIKTKLDLANIKTTNNDDGVVCRIYLVTEGYEEHKKNLTIKSVPLFIINSAIYVTPIVLRGLQQINEAFHSNADVCLTCVGDDSKIDKELNVRLFHEQVKQIHLKYKDMVYDKIEEILDIVDIGSKLPELPRTSKRLRME